MKKQIHKKKEIKPEQPQESRPERISYASLEISCSLAVKTILDFQITEKPGEHARGTFHVRIDFDEEKDRIDLSIPFFLWEKDAEGNRKKEPIFAGYPTDVRIDCMDGYREAQIDY